MNASLSSAPELFLRGRYQPGNHGTDARPKAMHNCWTNPESKSIPPAPARTNGTRQTAQISRWCRAM